MNSWLSTLRDPATRLALSATAVALVALSLILLFVTRGAAAPVVAPSTLIGYEQSGEFRYEVQYAADSVFEREALEPGSRFVADLVERLDLAFDYRLQGDRPLAGVPLEYEVVARLQEPELWSREYPLVPRTTVESADGTLTLDIPLELAQYSALLAGIRESTPLLGSRAELVIEARVYPAAATSQGTIEEPFVQAMTLGMDGTMLAISGELTKSQPGELGAATRVARGRLAGAQPLAMPLLLTSLLLAGGWFLLNRRLDEGASSSEAILADAQRLTKGALVRAHALPEGAEALPLVEVESLADLARVAHELMRPVIATPEGEGYRFTVLEGASGLRYDFTPRPAAEARPERHAAPAQP